MKRRDFVVKLGVAALGSAAVPEFAACATSAARDRERVAIAGVVIAGLVTALRLRDAGIDAIVYESASRVGGRMHSERRYWAQGQHTEWCGAMVDSLHLNIRGLARRFNLRLLDTYAARPPGARDTCYLDGRYYPMTEADRDFAKIYPILQAQLARVDPLTTYATATPTARRLDAMSMREWIEQIRSKRSGRTARALDRAIVSQRVWSRNRGAQRAQFGDAAWPATLVCAESRAERTRLLRPALHFSRRKPGASRGNCRHRFRPEAFASNAAFSAFVAPALDRTSSRFDHLDRPKRSPPIGSSWRFRLLHCALSTTPARTSIRSKINAIENLGYGYHTKLHLQFDTPRVDAAFPPLARADDGTDLDDAASAKLARFFPGQRGFDGSIEAFTAGDAGNARHSADAVRAHRGLGRRGPSRARVLRATGSNRPGVAVAWNGKATFGNAQADPNILASYSCWLVGQCTTIAGHEARPQGRVHFAGEHTSVAYQGFMEGGAESGFRAAGEILADYRIRARYPTGS